MSLEKVGVNNVYNDLSPELRKKLENRILSFGKKVRYKFDISHNDPHPDNKGQKVWPFSWTLDPVTFNITDKLENRAGVQKVKKIGIVEETNDRGEPSKFRRIRIAAIDKGIAEFNLEKIEDVENVFYLELHPKLTGGDFADVSKRQLMIRIDEQAAATQARTERTARNKAMRIAEEMSDKDIIDFADAMNWDSSDDVEILRNKVEEQAEQNPVYFNDLVAGENMKYQAIIKQAMNKGHISFDPGEYNFKWANNNMVIGQLQNIDNGKNEIQKFAEFLQSGGAKAESAFKKIKALVTEKAVTA